ncbi:MAG: hypothetical protein SU899_00440, partial [Chloroflexota bacterium]|nr:hypothetical protein [Chloroflexota bacterium]
MSKARWCQKPIYVLVAVALVLFLGIVAGPMAETVQANTDGWEWQNPLPQGNLLRDIWGTSSTDVFAVGGGGVILHYDGISWTLMNSGTTYDLYGVWGNSSNDVFAVGDTGTILHYDGTSWT